MSDISTAVEGIQNDGSLTGGTSGFFSISIIPEHLPGRGEGSGLYHQLLSARSMCLCCIPPQSIQPFLFFSTVHNQRTLGIVYSEGGFTSVNKIVYLQKKNGGKKKSGIETYLCRYHSNPHTHTVNVQLGSKRVCNYHMCLNPSLC